MADNRVFDRNLYILVKALRKQNDQLVSTNEALVEQNNKLTADRIEMGKYCESISALADIIVQVKQDSCETYHAVRQISNALIDLHGQLAATGVLEEARQRRSPIQPYEKKQTPMPMMLVKVPPMSAISGKTTPADFPQCLPCEPEPLDKCFGCPWGCDECMND